MIRDDNTGKFAEQQSGRRWLGLHGLISLDWHGELRHHGRLRNEKTLAMTAYGAWDTHKLKGSSQSLQRYEPGLGERLAGNTLRVK